MERPQQEPSGKRTESRYQRQSLDKPFTSNQAVLSAEEEEHDSIDSHAAKDTQFKAASDEDRTCVAELAYGLYEQRGRKDGHDLEDWFNAEQHIMTQGRESRLKS
jgi:Protein of unknown function (DUF2934)